MSQVSWLAAYLPQWCPCAPSPWLKRSVAMGYQLQFWVRPPCFFSIVNAVVGYDTSGPCFTGEQRLVQPLFCCPDGGWGWGLHPILDLPVLNKYLQTYKFKMLSLRQLLNAIGPGDWFYNNQTHRRLLSNSNTPGPPAVSEVTRPSHLHEMC